MRVLHIADIHWRGLSRHEEYILAFNDLFKRARALKPDIIYVGGDIVHSKTQGISPELIENLTWWFTELANIAPTHVILGNHDRMIMRKAQTSLIPSKWIKSYKEVLEVPNWEFVDRLVVDGVQYIHGEAGTARTKCRADMMNTVQGHLHTQCYIEHYVGQNFRVFGMQVGCGIDHDTYAMAYAKRGKKPSIACGVVLGGTTPINLLMPL